ncbi:MAG: hypothetical protein Q8O99_05120 [bacterium]|nr:hypothetical protein [bacterium]
MLLNRTPGETWDYLIKGGKDGEGVIKGDGSKLLQYFGYEGDPEKQDPRVYENTKSTVRVLGELKLGNLRKYITKKEGTMVNRAAFFMSDAQKKAFMADTTISTHAKETLQRLITSKSGNMDEVSRVLDSGLVRSGVTHTKREELISQSPQKDMTLSEFQMQRDEMKKFEEGSV